VALEMGQVAVSGTVPLFLVPSGPVNASLFAASSGVYVGTSTAVTTANGMELPASTPVPIATFPASTGAQLYATVGTAATTVAVFYSLSTGG